MSVWNSYNGTFIEMSYAKIKYMGTNEPIRKYFISDTKSSVISGLIRFHVKYSSIYVPPREMLW